MQSTVECSLNPQRFRRRFGRTVVELGIFEDPETYEEWLFRDDIGSLTADTELVPEDGLFEESMLEGTLIFTREPRDVETERGATATRTEFEAELTDRTTGINAALRESDPDTQVGLLITQFPFPDVEWFTDPGDTGYLTVEIEYDHDATLTALKYESDYFGDDREFTDEDIAELRTETRQKLETID